MAYTVKQVSKMSGVSVRTLHFYDELDLLKPAYYGSKGYRYYEEPQLLTLQQILFYRELGFELKEIKRTLRNADFEKADALHSHREVLESSLHRTRTLIETIGNTITHLKGAKPMNTEDMFAGFTVAAGKDRFGEHIRLGGEPSDCKVSAKDTNGAMCAFEFTGTSCGPRHLHHDQDEWIYVIHGQLEVEVGKERRHVLAGESVFLPRNVAHGWAAAGDKPAKIINVYQPAGKMESFFREIGLYDGVKPIHEALSLDQLSKVFQDHGIKLAGPPLVGEWTVSAEGQIARIA